MQASRWVRCPEFQSTLPAGGATRACWFGGKRVIVSIHAPRGGSDAGPVDAGGGNRVSIHAPRGGSDFGTGCGGTGSSSFNPRSPRGERPMNARFDAVDLFQSTLPAGGATAEADKPAYPPGFQSTLPAGGATQRLRDSLPLFSRFNPRSPRGERRSIFLWRAQKEGVSIHAPRGGSDQKEGE